MWVTPAATLGGLAVVVVAFILIRNYLTPAPPAPLAPSATQVLLASITGLPASEFESIGLGTATQRITRINGSALTGASGKPEVFYLGAEYCPFCAAQRWAMIISLSEFGTFSGVETTSSSSTDSYPNTPTFTFRNATFTSDYIDFRSVETSDRDRNPLQSPTAAEQVLVNAYDNGGSIPFVDFGNRYAFSGSTYQPDALAGMTWTQVAAALAQPGSVQAKAIIGSANLMTAAICRLTGDQPAAVCSTSAIQSLEKKIG